MKYIILLSIIAIACTKSGYIPDHDQADCKRCVSITQKYYDSTSNGLGRLFETDTVYDGFVCNYIDPRTGDSVTHLTSLMNNLHGQDSLVRVGRICNSAGEVLHWERYVDKIVR